MALHSFVKHLQQYGVPLAVLFVVFGVGVAIGKPSPFTAQTAGITCWYTNNNGCQSYTIPSGSCLPGSSNVQPANCGGKSLPLPWDKSSSYSSAGDAMTCDNGGNQYCQQQGKACMPLPDMPFMVCVGGSSAASVASSQPLASFIVDDSDPVNFRAVPALRPDVPYTAAYLFEHTVAPAGAYAIADWDFRQATPGTYNVYVTWAASPLNDAKVMYTVLQPGTDGTLTTLAQTTVDQTKNPSPDMVRSKVAFQKIASISFNGLPPIVEVSGLPKSQYSLDAVMLASPPSSSSSFSSSAVSSSSAVACTGNSPTGASPYDFAIGDLNGDGKTDLAVANFATNSVSVFLNNGNGTFAAKTDYEAGTGPTAVAAGDFNGDGKMDLAVANFTSNTVSIFINNGNGTFAPKTDYPTGVHPMGIIAGDLNGDGKIDVAVADNGNALSVLLNTGKSFVPKTDYPAGSNPNAIAIGDLNGDGLPDLVVADDGSNALSVFLNTGNGTFAPKTDYPTGINPNGVAIGDLNGDGLPDMAVTNESSNTISIFLNKGKGTFAAKTDYPVGTRPFNIAIADLNGDGKRDLAVTNGTSNTVSVLLNNGTTFTPKTDYQVGVRPYGIAAIGTNFNGNGLPDLVVGNNGSNTISVLLNTGNGMFSCAAMGSSSKSSTASIGSSVGYCCIGNIACLPSPGCSYTQVQCAAICGHDASSASSAGNVSSATSSVVQQSTTLTIAVASIGSMDTAVKNQKNITLLRFQAQALGGGVIFNSGIFHAENGNLLNAQNYSLWADTNADGVVDTVLQSGVFPQNGIVNFQNLKGGGYVIPGSSTTYFEVHADVASSLVNNSLLLSFDTGSSVTYVGGEVADTGQPLIGIRTLNSGGTVSGTNACTNNCGITVTVNRSKLWNLGSQGDLFVSRDTQPRSHQLLGGAVGDEILRLQFRAQNEDIDVTNLQINSFGGLANSVDALLLYKAGETTPFATATTAGCGSDAVQKTDPNGTAVSAFCATMQSQQLVVKDGQNQIVSVIPRMKSDGQGAVSGDKVQLWISKQAISNNQTGAGAVRARGVVSGNSLTANNGNGTNDGEIFIGTDTVAPNADIIGSANQTVLAKITSITNANPDPDGMAVPTGIYPIGQFTFTAATNTNVSNGLNKATFSGIILNVNAPNVAIDAASFKLYNKNNASAQAACFAESANGIRDMNVESGSFLVECDNLKGGAVDTRIPSGASETFVLQGNIQISQTGTSPSGLKVSLNNFTDPTTTAYGPVSSHVQWIDEDGQSSMQFVWIEYGSTTVASTQYGSANATAQKAPPQAPSAPAAPVPWWQKLFGF